MLVPRPPRRRVHLRPRRFRELLLGLRVLVRFPTSWYVCTRRCVAKIVPLTWFPDACTCEKAADGSFNPANEIDFTTR